MRKNNPIRDIKSTPYGRGELSYAVGRLLDNPPDDITGADVGKWQSGWESAKARHARYKERQK